MSEFWTGFISGVGSALAFSLIFGMVLTQAFFDAEDEEEVTDETQEKNINELQDIAQALTLDHKEPIFVFAADRSQFSLFMRVNGLPDSRYRFLEHVDQLKALEWKKPRILRVGNYYTRKDCAEIEAYLAAIGG